MSGTNPVATFTPPISTGGGVQNPTQYKANIDGAVAVAQRVIDNFAPRQSSPAAMTITADPGCVFSGTTLTELAAQTSGTITAPTGSNKRIDRLVFDAITGVISIITGTPTTGTPTAPTITAGKMPIAQILLQSTTTSITNSIITDERCYWTAPVTANSITNSQLAQMPAVSLKGNNTGSTANAADLFAYQVKPLLGVDSPVICFPTSLSSAWVSNTTLNFSCSQIMLQYAGLVNDPFCCTGVATVTANLAANWAGGGNLDTGSLAANTWYYGYVINTGSQGAGSIIYSTSSTGPSMPGGYFGCSGIVTCFRTDGSSHIIGFIQNGRKWQWRLGSNLSALPQIASGSTGSITSLTAESITSVFPTAIGGSIKMIASATSAAGEMVVAPNASYTAPQSCPALVQGTGGSNISVLVEFIPESGNVYYGSLGSGCILYAFGFELNV